MEPKWLPKCFKNQALVRGASGRASGSFWRPKKRPRGSRERPGRTPGASQEAQRRSKTNPRIPQMTPRRGKMSPRRARVSSGRSREASGSDFVRISEEFTSNARRPRRSQLKPPGAGRVAAAQGHKRSYGLAVSILGRLSPLSPCCCSLSCRSCSCCSCRSLCSRLSCIACTLSGFSRFPFHDNQVSVFTCVVRTSRFSRNEIFPYEDNDFARFW